MGFKKYGIIPCLCLLAVFIFLSHFMTGRAEKERYSAKYANLTMDTIPELEHFAPVSSNEKEAIMKAMDAIPIGDSEEFFVKQVEAFCAEKEMIKLDDLTMEKDELDLLAGENRKSYQDVTLKIDLKYLSSDWLSETTAVHNLSEDLIQQLRNYTYINKKVKYLEIRTLYENGAVIETADQDYAYDSEAISRNRTYDTEFFYKDQAKTEKDAQTLAYNYAKKKREFVLQRFGVIPGSQKLHIEYSIEDDYFLMGSGDVNEKLETRKTALEQVYEEIAAQVVAQNKMQRYMQEQDVKLVTVAFTHRFLEGAYLEFERKVEE